MKEMIAYLYNIDIIETLNYKNDLIFKTNNTHYLYKEVAEPEKILFINKYLIILNQYNFFSYIFKTNIYNEIISKNNNINFVLIDIGCNYKKTIDLDDMITFYKRSNLLLKQNIKYQNNWDSLWENKIDYITSHFMINYNSHKNIDTIFYFYISVAENTLHYLNALKYKYPINNDSISFTHRRIFFPNAGFDFYNPLNFIIDLEVRDIGEYIKTLFYNHDDYVNELHYYLKTHNLDFYTTSYLYVRIIYPSIFFDDYESNNIDINKYCNLDNYYNFSKKIYEIISSYIKIDEIKF